MKLLIHSQTSTVWSWNCAPIFTLRFGSICRAGQRWVFRVLNIRWKWLKGMYVVIYCFKKCEALLFHIKRTLFALVPVHKLWYPNWPFLMPAQLLTWALNQFDLETGKLILHLQSMIILITYSPIGKLDQAFILILKNGLPGTCVECMEPKTQFWNCLQDKPVIQSLKYVWSSLIYILIGIKYRVQIIFQKISTRRWQAIGEMGWNSTDRLHFGFGQRCAQWKLLPQ